MQQQQLTDTPSAAGNAWLAQLQCLAARCMGAASAQAMLQNYRTLLTPEYQTLLTPRYALQDILHLQQITTPHCQRVSIIRPCSGVSQYRLHFYSQQERYLDEYIPLLGNMGFRVMDQVQFRVIVGGAERFIKSFTVQVAKPARTDTQWPCRTLLAALQAVMDGKADNDALNQLCVFIGMDWQAVDVLRAYRNYFLQLGQRSTLRSVQQALINNPEVAFNLYSYFDARFRPNPDWHDPIWREEQALFPLRLQLLASMAGVADINDDRILRTLFNLIDATMRCNFHWRRSQDDYFIAFKINNLGVIDMPSPRPGNEIYVHAADMEGIHLRAGKIARGGIRWSDRPDDFRTEILGLMQTQTSKNALIIPTGAKGGFVVKQKLPLLDLKARGEQAYLTLMRGLLDLTDNYHDGKPVKPAHCVCYDDSDPYLVVAADKGTAQFSDLANGVAAEYQFWLHDAFASGGSKGYDHKALGITARGAWECVKRHFCEIGKDIQTEAFTVVGIGSMDGDVFGNGMLLSPCIRLLAAFSGQHIFLDPNPSESNAPFQERQRLFNQLGSTWADYDRQLISQGGGVYLRHDKDIPLSAEIKQWLGLHYPSLDGETLIRHLLSAPVELLWLGGIGTYVKASNEKNETVGDAANDNVRINAANLRAKVVGEGANLGFTQKARIEYALNGGCINTDAVDNSAGVDTSDHEVNLKILLTGLHKQQLIADYQPLFIELTDEVCQQVLANNIAQSLCLSLELRRNTGSIKDYLECAEHLQRAGFLDRRVESFPSGKDILARQPPGLTRPELAVLMAASKMYLTAELQANATLMANDGGNSFLQSYFPAKIGQLFKAQLAAHPLADEIKATVISNKIINQAGCRLLAKAFTGERAFLLDYVGCYLGVEQIVQADSLRKAIAVWGGTVAAGPQYRALLALENSLESISQGFMQQGRLLLPTAPAIDTYQQLLRVFEDWLQQYPTPVLTADHQQHLHNGLPESLALRLAVLQSAEDFPWYVVLAEQTNTDLLPVVKAYHDICGYLGLYEANAQLAKLVPHDTWESQLLADLQADSKQITAELLKKLIASPSANCTDYFQASARQQPLNQYRNLCQQIGNAKAGLMPYLVWGKALQVLAIS